MSVRVDRAQLYSSARFRLCSIARRDAEQMVKDGLARRISRAKERRLVIQLVERNRQFEIDDEIKPLQSTVTLNFSDMELNAAGTVNHKERRRGKRVFDDFAGHRRRIIGNRVDQSMTKVEMWARTGDTKAVRVGPAV